MFHRPEGGRPAFSPPGSRPGFARRTSPRVNNSVTSHVLNPFQDSTFPRQAPTNVVNNNVHAEHDYFNGRLCNRKLNVPLDILPSA
eukprot:9280875-Pyramimonas_sp.AAC.1